jgi:hypothetical protein
MELSELIERRRSIRAFHTISVEEDKINAILAASQLAPSAGDLQEYKIVVVTDAQTKALKSGDGPCFVSPWRCPLWHVVKAPPLCASGRRTPKCKSFC